MGQCKKKTGLMHVIFNISSIHFAVSNIATFKALSFKLTTGYYCILFSNVFLFTPRGVLIIKQPEQLGPSIKYVTRKGEGGGGGGLSQRDDAYIKYTISMG